MEPVTSAQTIRDHKYIWRYWGLLPRSTDGPWYKSCFLVFHALCWTFIACLVLSLVVDHTIADIIAVVVLATTFILVYFKAFFLRWNIKKVYSVFDIMHELEQDTTNDETEQQFLRVAEKQSRRLRLIMTVFCYTGITMFIFQPLIDGHKLMYPSLYPFDWTTSRALYYGTFFFQAFFNYFVCAPLPSLDMLCPATYSFLVAYLEILRYRLENLALSSSNKNVREHKLRQCVKYHITCLKLSRLIDEIFSIHLFLQISSSALIVCSTAFQFTVISPTETPIDFAFLFEYMAAMIFQLFVPCYYSTLVTFCSAKLANSMYFCDWTGESQRFKTSMIVLMVRAKNPIVLKVYKKFFFITLEVFVSVMRFAYTMLTFIKSMQ